MSLLKRLEQWRRAKAEERTAAAKSEREAMRVGEPSGESEADAELDVIDAGPGTGVTL